MCLSLTTVLGEWVRRTRPRRPPELPATVPADRKWGGTNDPGVPPLPPRPTAAAPVVWVPMPLPMPPPTLRADVDIGDARPARVVGGVLALSAPLLPLLPLPVCGRLGCCCGAGADAAAGAAALMHPGRGDGDLPRRERLPRRVRLDEERC